MQSVNNNLHICLFIHILMIKIKRTINESSWGKRTRFLFKQLNIVLCSGNAFLDIPF